MSFDVDALVRELGASFVAELGDGWSRISTLVESQGKKLAVQAEMLTASRITPGGQLNGDDALFNWFVEELRQATLSLARTVVSLTVLTLEKAWNALVGVLWGAINKALTGAGLVALPIPGVPAG